MDKLKLNKGFTLIEMIFVLSLMSIMMLLFVSTQSVSLLNTTMLRSKELILQAQLTAIETRQRQTVIFTLNTIEFDSETLLLPSNMVCDNKRITFNAMGNINQAQRVCCYEGSRTKCLVFQLGSGRCSLE